jgi:hypothetical protein
MQNGSFGVDQITVRFCAATIETQKIGGLGRVLFLSHFLHRS